VFPVFSISQREKSFIKFLWKTVLGRSQRFSDTD
jgi:hypothetical protein